MWCLCGDAAASAPTSIPSVPPYHRTHCLKRRRRARASSLGPTPSNFVHICAGSASQFSLFVAHQPLRGSAWIRAARNSHFKVRASELGWEIWWKRPGCTKTCRFLINIRIEPLKLLFFDTSLKKVFVVTKKRPDSSHHMLVCIAPAQNARAIPPWCLLHANLRRWPRPRWAQWFYNVHASHTAEWLELGVSCALFPSLQLPAGLVEVVSGAAVTPASHPSISMRRLLGKCSYTPRLKCLKSYFLYHLWPCQRGAFQKHIFCVKSPCPFNVSETVPRRALDACPSLEGTDADTTSGNSE